VGYDIWCAQASVVIEDKAESEGGGGFTASEADAGVADTDVKSEADGV